MPKDIDLITHGSPCQDFSIAGKLAGGDKGSGTRSSLMWCTVDIVEKTCPKYVIWENVKNLLSAKNRHNFDSYIQIMNEMGYNSYYQVLNAKNFGIPQNRERVFTVSIRKDMDTGYKFPEGEELKLRLKDLLEDEVDEKYYLSDKFLAGLLRHNEHHTEKGTGFIWKPRDLDGVASTLRANGALAPTDNTIKVNRVGGIFDTETTKHQAGSIYDKEGLSPTLDVMQGGWRQPSIIEESKVATAMRGRYNSEGETEQQIEISNREIANSITTVQKDSMVGECLQIKEATKIGYKEAHEGDGVNISSRMKYQRGNVQKDSVQTLMANGGNDRGVITKDMRVRKLTPLECWRLMGFDDEDFYKAQSVPTSNTQLYKQARKLDCGECTRSGVQEFIWSRKRKEIVV